MKRNYTFLIVAGLFAVFLSYNTCISSINAKSTIANPIQSPYLSKPVSMYSISHTDTTEKEIKELLKEIEKQLDNVAHSRSNYSLAASKMLNTAEKLSEMGSEEGYAKIKNFLLNIDWSKARNRKFYSEIYRHASYRMEFTDVFYEGLKKASAPSQSLSFSCSAFRSNPAFKKFRFEPKYTYGLLSAMARVEETGKLDDYHSTYETCKESLRQHLLVPRLRNALLETYQDSLSQGELIILNRFLEIMAPPDVKIHTLMYKTFLDVQWYQPYDHWLKQYPSAKCKTKYGDTLEDLEELDKLWAYRCELPGERFRKRYYFYPGRDAKSNRLQKVRLSYPVTEVDVITPLASILNDTLGEGKKIKSTHDYGSSAWSNIRSWQADDYRLLLFNNSYPADWWHNLPKVELYSRSQDLREWIEAVQPQYYKGSLSEIKRQERNRVFEDLRTHLTEVREKWELLDSAEVVLEMIHRIMNYSAPDEQIRAAKLYLADLLVDRLTEIGKTAAQFEQWEKRLSEYGVKFTMHHYNTSHNNTFRIQILEERLNGYWADETTVWAVNNGRGTYFGAEDKDLFKKIIPFASNYLKRHPDTHVKNTLLYALARAHETAWALSLAHPKDGHVNPENYEDDAEMHRKEAVYYYEKLIDQKPEEINMEIIKIRWRWVKLNVSTNSRRYYIYTLG